MRTKSSIALPLPARKALSKLGADIRDARRRRRIPSALLAERAQISRNTLVRLEKGNPTVAIGIYAAVLFSLGLIDRLAELVAARNDEVGLALEEQHLPQRIRLPKSKTPRAPSLEPSSKA
jgi:transcriptional regulator with XRE-family HTH domain